MDQATVGVVSRDSGYVTREELTLSRLHFLEKRQISLPMGASLVAVTVTVLAALTTFFVYVVDVRVAAAVEPTRVENARLLQDVSQLQRQVTDLSLQNTHFAALDIKDTESLSDRTELKAHVAELQIKADNNASGLRNATGVIGQQVVELETQMRGLSEVVNGELVYLNGNVKYLWDATQPHQLPAHVPPTYSVIHDPQANASTAR